MHLCGRICPGPLEKERASSQVKREQRGRNLDGECTGNSRPTQDCRMKEIQVRERVQRKCTPMVQKAGKRQENETAVQDPSAGAVVKQVQAKRAVHSSRI